MEACGAVDVYLHAFLPSSLIRGERLVLDFSSFVLRNELQIPTDEEAA
jgi:hypothetical protein